MTKLKEKILAIILVCLSAAICMGGIIFILVLEVKLVGILLIAAGLIFAILAEPFVTRSGL